MAYAPSDAEILRYLDECEMEDALDCPEGLRHNPGLVTLWRSRFEGTCDHCGEGFAFDEKPWYWKFGDKVLWMHAKCLADWLPRLENDTRRIVGRGLK